MPDAIRWQVLSAARNVARHPTRTHMQDFRRLDVWRKAHQLALDVDKAVERLPRRRCGNLQSQCHRAAFSISANIVEGCGKRSNADFARYLDNATGSCSELEYHLLTARALQVFDSALHQRLETQVIEIRKMLIALARTVRTKGPKPPHDDDDANTD